MIPFVFLYSTVRRQHGVAHRRDRHGGCSEVSASFCSVGIFQAWLGVSALSVLWPGAAKWSDAGILSYAAKRGSYKLVFMRSPEPMIQYTAYLQCKGGAACSFSFSHILSRYQVGDECLWDDSGRSVVYCTLAVITVLLFWEILAFWNCRPEFNSHRIWEVKVCRATWVLFTARIEVRPGWSYRKWAALNAPVH